MYSFLHTAELSLPISSQGNTDIGNNLPYIPFNMHSEGFPENPHMRSSTNLTQWRSPSMTIGSSGFGLSISPSLHIARSPPVASAHRLVGFFNQLGVDRRRYLLAIAHKKGLKFTDVLTSLANSAENLFIKEHVDYEHMWISITSTLPSLQLNNIRITQASFWAAIQANGRVLGFELENYLDGEAISPISVLSVSFINTEAKRDTENFSTVPKDLRPLRVQTEKEHHAYLDVLPFPKFREQILKVVSYNPPLFDEEELCMDLMNNGLVCWGSQNGNESIDACMPWDSRSWEPQLWFLNKYWFLVGGQDDEMWGCAKWWHGMRGEKIC